MIGLDTNVLVRYLAQDDPVQSAKANAIIRLLTPERPGYITVLSIVELVWVLVRVYQADRDFIARTLESWLRAKEVVVEQLSLVWRALNLYKTSKADFADNLVERSCKNAGCDYVLTFDVAAAKTAGMRLIK